ncbi:MAG: hypothetical protein FJ295_08335 [Planctomycetes bacterium]|nr:hypothetical protein [Planctomycetota bacterium]
MMVEIRQVGKRSWREQPGAGKGQYRSDTVAFWDRSRWLRRSIAMLLALAAVSLTIVPSNAQQKSQRKRVAAPQWDKKEVRRIFFENAFDGTVLIGERPAEFGAGGKPNGSKVAGSGSSGGTRNQDASVGDGAGATESGWASRIDGSVIEDEVKAVRIEVDECVTNPTDFAGRGYKLARMHFTTLAMLFGIASEYDGNVRWKSDAPSARDAFARAAANAKAGGNAQVYAEAKARKQDLQALIGGEGFANKTNAEAKTVWGQTCDRLPLMQRLELSQSMRMQPWTADKAGFKANKESLLHEAQIVAAIGEVLSREGMADADADEYTAFCHSLKKGALDVLEAIKLDNDDLARKAVGDINLSCDKCHGSYRN